MIVQIAAAFPGQFAIEELLGMDIRELAWWARQATRRVLENQMRALQAARASMLEAGAYTRITAEMEMRLRRLKLGSEEATREGWEELKAMGGR